MGIFPWPHNPEVFQTKVFIEVKMQAALAAIRKHFETMKAIPKIFFCVEVTL